MLLVALLLAAAPPEPVRLELDVRESSRHVLRARISLPVKPGPLVLAYPKWIPGHHRVAGRIGDLVDVRAEAQGQVVPWRRDEVDPYLFRLEVPRGASRLEVSLTRVAVEDAAAGGAIVSFHEALLYPLGTPAAAQRWQATLLVPEGWQAGTALEVASGAPGRIAFEPVGLDQLVDSPVVLARHRREIPLGRAGPRPVSVVLVAEQEAGLALPPVWKERLDRLVAETDALTGARHFDRYRFLLASVEGVKGTWLEHHQSVALGLGAAGLEEKGDPEDLAYVLPHEYLHSWNGKHRRPRGFATADFQEPVRTRDLWIYEGLTEYLGYVLSARAGFFAPADFREMAANDLGRAHRPGGPAWRTLDDAAVTFPAYASLPPAWSSARRNPWNVYMEGFAAWLEADALLREASGGTRSLDDLARAFLGGEEGPPSVRPFDRSELLEALWALAPLDWKGFFDARLEALGTPSEEAIHRLGWRLTFAPELGPYISAKLARSGPGSLRAGPSLGLAIDGKQSIVDVVPGSPAWDAGLFPGLRVLAVNGRRLSAESLARALRAAPASGGVDLLVEEGDLFRTVRLAYTGGPRFHALERIPDRPDLLERILAPRGAGAGAAPGMR